MVRTGVSVLDIAGDGFGSPVPAGGAVLNGVGECTGFLLGLVATECDVGPAGKGRFGCAVSEPCTTPRLEPGLNELVG